MKIKSDIKIKIDYLMDEDVLNYRIPKLILQPLVENSFKYSDKDVGEELEINIQIRKSNNIIKIIVLDNGAGIEKEKIKKIISGNYITSKSGFGLSNIIERLMVYQQEIDINNIIKIDSKLGQYTMIELVIDMNKIVSLKKR